MKSELILVVGANGTVGTELVRQLKGQGYRVRGTTSKAPTSPEQVHVNLATGEGIKAAFEGVDRAFLLSPPGYADQYGMLSPQVQEAKRRGLKKVVLMTAMGANASDSTPFRRVEIELEKSGLNYNIIRPNWFLQNFNTFWAHDINGQNKIALPAGTAKVSFIDARDISAVAAKLIVSDKFNGRDFDLTGPEAVDHAQVAAAISKVTGRKIVYADSPPELLQRTLLSFGLKEDYVNFMLLIFSYLKEGYDSGLTSSVQEITGAKPRSLEQYVSDLKNVWMK